MKPDTIFFTKSTRWLFLSLLVALTLLLGLRPTATMTAAPPLVAASAANGRIAFSSARDGNAEIYTMNANGSNPLRLTTNSAYDAEPSWSPDGSQIVFRSDRDGGNNEIYVMNADGSQQTRLTNNPAHDYQPTWSPGGGKIAFVREQNGNQDIYIMTSTGGDQTNLTNSAPPVFERDPAWSPASNRIAFSRNEAGHVEVYVMNANGSNQINLTNFPAAADEEPSWSPDGEKIAFVSWRDGGNSEIFVMNANGSSPTNLTNTSGTDYQPVWSPDGSQIAFTTDRNGNNEVYAMNANGSSQTNLTNHSALDYLPDWGPEAAVEDDDGVDADVEDDAPNGGDGNFDGEPDSEQANVASFPNSTDGSYVTLEEVNGAQLSDVQAIANPSPADAPDVDFPIGFLDFRIAGLEHGGTAVLKLFLESDAPIDTYYKYGPTSDNADDHWYEFLYDGTTGVKFEGDMILLHFKDGERGDDDLDANGVITDAGTLADCIKVQAIEITGSSSVQTGQVLDLQIKFIKQNPMDPDPSSPKTFQWSTDGLIGGQGTRQAQYRWNTATPPTQTVSATVKNCEGTQQPGTATSSKTITVTANCTKLTGVTIGGPNEGTTGQTYTFTATVQPASATNPTFQWSPAPASGQGTAQASYVWNNTGNQTVSVSASNCSGSGTDSASHTITITPGCTNLTAVTINGPSNGVTGQTYSFTAETAPPSATTPFTYNWSPLPSSGQGSSQASYVWNAAGDQTISVSVSNCSGNGSDSDNHPITIAASCTNLSGVTINGPINGVVGQTYSFTAGVAPPSATGPFSYTWSPTPSSGQGSSQANYVWNSTGDQTISVSASNCGGDGTASDSYTVAITQSCTQLTAVNINGPSSGVTGQTYTFTAAAIPAAATPPVSYVWAPEPAGGQGTATVSYVWSSAGDQTVSVSAGNCGGAGIANDDYPINIQALPPSAPIVRVIDEAGLPVSGAAIYRNGMLAGHTAADGKLTIPDLKRGDALVATQLILAKTPSAPIWVNPIYRVYITSLDIPKDGEPIPLQVLDPANVPPLTVKKGNTLIGFNLIVSVSWDANTTYLTELQQGFAAASGYLYDASDGQMLIERVTIYDDAVQWPIADFKISAQNNLLPYIGLGRTGGTYVRPFINFGRYYDGRSANQGPWTEPAAYRTLIRLLGNDKLHLGDSDRYLEDGQWKFAINCTSPAIMGNSSDQVNATLMAYQFNATEFSMQGVPGLWSEETCTRTRQWQVNAESDWETIVERFSDANAPARWLLKTPATHGGVVAGPHAIPVNDWSKASIGDNAHTGICATPPPYQATYAGQPVAGAHTYLGKKLLYNGEAFTSWRYQGVTDASGLIMVLGAATGDEVRMTDTDPSTLNHATPGNLYGQKTINCPPERSVTADSAIEIALEPAAFTLQVSAAPGASADEVLITVESSAALSDAPTVQLHQPGAAALLTVTMQFDNSSGSYTGRVTPDTDLGLSGIVAASATDREGNTASSFTTVEIALIPESQDTTARSADGLLELYLPAGSLPDGGQINIEAAPLPGALPDGLVAVSGPYTISAESGVTLDDQANLTLRYLDVGGTLGHVDLSAARIYHWDGSQWTALNGNSGLGSVSVLIDDFGTYALLAEAAYPIFLPVSIR